MKKSGASQIITHNYQNFYFWNILHANANVIQSKIHKKIITDHTSGPDVVYALSDIIRVVLKAFSSYKRLKT